MEARAGKGNLVELGLLFFGVPAAFLLPLPASLRVGLAVVAILWIGWLVFRGRMLRILGIWGLGAKGESRALLLRVLLGGIAVFFLMDHFLPEKRFVIFRNLPLFFGIVAIYSIVSVTIQEIVYRLFFFERYRQLLPGWALILLNGLAFGLAHAFFGSWLVVFLTTVGGFLFAWTYQRSRSLLLVWAEHALYGLWLFALGIGELLAFPMPA